MQTNVVLVLAAGCLSLLVCLLTLDLCLLVLLGILVLFIWSVEDVHAYSIFKALLCVPSVLL